MLRRRARTAEADSDSWPRLTSSGDTNNHNQIPGRADLIVVAKNMGMLGGGLFLVGILMSLVGFGGFFDTRKVDRRFKTGYRNNERDTRDFRRSAKRILYGIGICIVGSAVLSLSSPSEQPASSASAVGVTPSRPTLASEALPASSELVQLDPAPAAAQKNDSGVTLGSNERVVASVDTPIVASAPQSVASAQSRDTALQMSSSSVGCVDDGSFFGANVCRSGTLAAAYDLEVREYESAQARIGVKDVGVRIEQEKWLEQVVKGCSDMPCLTNASDARVSDLRGRYRNDG
ncbi:Lipoprotein [Caballeronia sp. S22]